jgi:hypothetical protein
VVAAVEIVLSVVMLGAFLWAAAFLIPRAVRERDALAIGSALMVAALAILAWLWIGIGVGTAGPG